MSRVEARGGTRRARLRSRATRWSRSARSARYRRRAWDEPVVAVVGTERKDEHEGADPGRARRRLEVHATTGNLNNLIGVPLTLLAMPDGADVAVVEMGTNQPGEIAAAARDRRAGHRRRHVDRRRASRRASAISPACCARRWRRPTASRSPSCPRPSRRSSRRRRSETRRVRPGSTPAICGRRAGRSRPTDAARSTLDGVDVRAAAARSFTIFATRCWRSRSRARLGVSVEDAGRGIAAMPAPPMRVERRRARPDHADQRRVQLESRLGARGDRAARARREGTTARRRARHDARARRAWAAVCTTTWRGRRSTPGSRSSPASASSPTRFGAGRRRRRARHCRAGYRRALVHVIFAARSGRRDSAQGLARDAARAARDADRRVVA